MIDEAKTEKISEEINYCLSSWGIIPTTDLLANELTQIVIKHIENTIEECSDPWA